jgi:Sigma-70, region 4
VNERIRGSEEQGYDGVEASLSARAAGLDQREWHVLRLRFSENLNQDEIGERIGVSQMQVSRILRGALRKLLDAVRGNKRNGAGPHSTPPQATAVGALTGNGRRKAKGQARPSPRPQPPR